jgi:hypothetical protein
VVLDDEKLLERTHDAASLPGVSGRHGPGGGAVDGVVSGGPVDGGGDAGGTDDGGGNPKNGTCGFVVRVVDRLLL